MRRAFFWFGWISAPIIGLNALEFVMLRSETMVQAQAPAFVPEGFGAGAVGGEGQPVVRVTSLADSGAGTLRAALQGAASNRMVVFDVGGDIKLVGNLAVGGHHITIDGTTAPAPGITLWNATLSFETDSGGTANHVIVLGIRHRGPFGSRAGFQDNIAVTENAHDILFDQVSSSNAVDGCLDITIARNVTVQRSIIQKHFHAGDSASGAVLVKYDAYGITFHHNVMDTEERGPYCARDDSATTSAETMCDIVNDVNWRWGFNGGTQTGYGIGIDLGSRSNVVNGYFKSFGTSPGLSGRALDVDPFGSGGQAFASGNVSGNGVNVDAIGNAPARFAAPAVTIQPALTALSIVLAEAGARPLDALDQAIIADIQANGPQGGPTPIPTATATAAPSPTPSSTPSPTPTATPTAPAPTATPTPSPTSTPTPAPPCPIGEQKVLSWPSDVAGEQSQLAAQSALGLKWVGSTSATRVIYQRVACP